MLCTCFYSLCLYSVKVYILADYKLTWLSYSSALDAHRLMPPYEKFYRSGLKRKKKKIGKKNKFGLHVRMLVVKF